MTDSASGHLHQVRALFDAAMQQPQDARRQFALHADSFSDSVRRDVVELIAANDITDPVFDAPYRLPPISSHDASNLVDQRIGPYRIDALIGEGGMGAVYQAARADDQYRQRVAIKVVRRGLDADVTAARFRRERQILASLAHRNIATLLDGGVMADGRPFLVMEFVEGEPITKWCAHHESTTADRIALFLQVCSAVQHAHTALVIHRDIKPGNILVADDGTVKLLDFGIAKLLAGDDTGDDQLPLTVGEARTFTPAYASPEQIRGDVLTTATDVYSLGVVLYEMLTGRRPHAPASRALSDVERAVLDDPVPAPSAAVIDGAAAPRIRRQLRGDLDQIVLTALHRDQRRRYRSVEALSEDLRRYRDGLPVRAHRDWAGYRVAKFVRRNRTGVVGAALVFAVLAGGVAATLAQARRARAEQLKSSQVNRFLSDLLASVRPAMGGRDVPVSEVLDAAARRLPNELAGDQSAREALETVIGQSYQSLGQFAPAERHLRTALSLQQQLDGTSSRSVVVGLLNLAGLYLARGEQDRADSLLQQSLALHRRLTPVPDTLTAMILTSLGSVAHERGSSAEAEKRHGDALAIFRKELGPANDRVAASLNNVAVAIGEQNRMQEAESLHREAIAILRRNHPGPNAQVDEALNALATVLDFEGKSAAADSAYNDVLAMRRRLYGERHPMYAFTAFNYAMKLFDDHRCDEATRYARQIIALRDSVIPESHSSIAGSIQTIGRCLDLQGDTAGARRALEESLALRAKYLPAGSWLVANSTGLLGEHYIRVKEYQKAERLLLTADSALRRAFAADNPRVVNNVKRLVTLYEAWNRPERRDVFQRLVVGR